MINQCWTADELLKALERYESELRSSGKTRNTINTYVQHPERFIRWLTKPSVPVSTNSSPINSEWSKPTMTRSTYDPLKQYLTELDDVSAKLSFSQIERILGRPLPESARRYPAWWSNETSGSHSHSRSWMDPGWRTLRLDLNAATVEFQKGR